MLGLAALGVALWADALRRVYAVGRTWNDHFVAAVVSGCAGFYALQAWGHPGLAPLALLGVVGLWGLFWAVHRDTAPPLHARLLGWPSQTAYAFALWGGLTALIAAPFADHPLILGPEAAIPAALAGWGTLHAALWRHRVTRHAVPGLPARVVQLSDLHASALMHRAELDPLIDRVNALKPSLVLITGDLVMPFSEAEHGYLFAALERLEAPWRACPGNHDLPVLERLRAGAGGRLLVDEAQAVGPFWVAGVNFHWVDARGELERAVAKMSGGDGFRILMAHDPRLGAWVPPGAFDLILSGHTHGGQVAANMFGLAASVLRLLGVRDQGWFEGRHYVHAGNWLLGLPPRMGVAGEIAAFDPAKPPGR